MTIYTGKIELGQGIGTALAQIAADELDVDMKRIEMIHGDTERTPNEGQTAGSLSVTDSGTALRFACAEARALLLEAAAAKLGVAAAALKVRDGTVKAPGARPLTYWQLAQELNLKREASAQGQTESARRVSMGRQEHRAPRYSCEVHRRRQHMCRTFACPNMVHGRVVRPPSPGAQLIGVDEAAVKRLPGVIAIVRDGRFLAVAAEREEQAVKARDALAKAAKWQENATLPPSGEALYAHLMAIDEPAKVVASKNEPAAAAAKTLNATFTRPFQAHGSIGPSCAIAQWQGGKLTVWTHSQGVFPLRGDLSRAFGLEPKMIHCIHGEGSGCYGHNGADDVAFDAAMLARAIEGRPVQRAVDAR